MKNPSRLERAQWLLRSAARIITSDDGGPIRTILTGRQHKATGRYSSAKAGRGLPWEDRRELWQFWICEADANVVEYLAQPHRLEIDVGEVRPWIYFPDLREDLASSHVRITEIKKEYDGARDPRYAHKLRLAGSIYEGLGWEFRLVVEKELTAGTRLRNARAVQRYRHVRTSAQHVLSATEAVLRAGQPAPLHSVRAALGGGVEAEAVLYALVVRRVLALDLDLALDADAPVRLVPRHRDTLHLAGGPGAWR